MFKDGLVLKLNNLIESAVKNGGDLGGSYNQCMEDLHTQIEEIMWFLDLNTDYEIIETGNRGCFSPYKIIRKDRQ